MRDHSDVCYRSMQGVHTSLRLIQLLILVLSKIVLGRLVSDSAQGYQMQDEDPLSEHQGFGIIA